MAPADMQDAGIDSVKGGASYSMNIAAMGSSSSASQTICVRDLGAHHER